MLIICLKWVIFAHICYYFHLFAWNSLCNRSSFSSPWLFGMWPWLFGILVEFSAYLAQFIINPIFLFVSCDKAFACANRHLRVRPDDICCATNKIACATNWFSFFISCDKAFTCATKHNTCATNKYCRATYINFSHLQYYSVLCPNSRLLASSKPRVYCRASLRWNLVGMFASLHIPPWWFHLVPTSILASSNLRWSILLWYTVHHSFHSNFHLIFSFLKYSVQY